MKTKKKKKLKSLLDLIEYKFDFESADRQGCLSENDKMDLKVLDMAGNTNRLNHKPSGSSLEIGTFIANPGIRG